MAFWPLAPIAALAVVTGVVSASVLLTRDATLWSQGAPRRIELKGTDGPIFGLAWAPDGQTLATTGFKQVHLWRTGAAVPLRTFRAHTDLVRSV
jgi:WD40 repeat protein